MKIVQVDLRHEYTNGEALTMTTWLDMRPDLKVGVSVSLKDISPAEWRVVKLYDAVHEAADFDFHRKWDNNNYDKHKGLKV